MSSLVQKLHGAHNPAVTVSRHREDQPVLGDIPTCKAFFCVLAVTVTVLSGLQIAERSDLFKFIHQNGYGLPIRNSFAPDISSLIQEVNEQKPAKTIKSIKVFEGTKYHFQNGFPYGDGNPKAKVVIVEFSDYECSHCKVFHEVTFPKIKKKFIDTGLVYFVSGNFPLKNNHHSQKAAEASYCAGEQGQYWAMRDLLFENNLTLGDEKYLDLAARLKLDPARFETCMESGRYTKEILDEKQMAINFSVNSTPGFIIGLARDGGVVEGGLMSPSPNWTNFKRLLDKFLTLP